MLADLHHIQDSSHKIHFILYTNTPVVARTKDVLALCLRIYNIRQFNIKHYNYKEE